MGLWVPHEMNEDEPTIGLGEGPPASWPSVAGGREPKMHPGWGGFEIALSSRGDESISLSRTDVPPRQGAAGAGTSLHLAFPEMFGSYVHFVYLFAFGCSVSVFFFFLINLIGG